MVGNAASVFGSPGVRQRMPSRKEVSERSRDRGARAHVPPQSEKDGTTRGTLARYVAQPAPWELKIGPFVTFGGALRVRRASISQSAKDSTSQELHQRWFTIRRQRAAPTLDHDTTSKGVNCGPLNFPPLTVGPLPEAGASKTVRRGRPLGVVEEGRKRGAPVCPNVSL